ncbi:hypothetical protein DCS_03803 [Drechmeria coniospora]|uniref:Protein CAP22 n=1 Tax=Drechmeria coniospora TaxID=98403 RepID=A0A151GI74_DRECN|nr:hypothetical protein DCS_03803 [Drechmeria coniospora]KYK56797.1 hypothetical protein DCS_03803 [Drechmeria coniospora]ODA78379.1 hypothetical protein RJ55_05760 [Drechmeria coniospora]
MHANLLALAGTTLLLVAQASETAFADSMGLQKLPETCRSTCQSPALALQKCLQTTETDSSDDNLTAAVKRVTACICKNEEMDMPKAMMPCFQCINKNQSSSMTADEMYKTINAECKSLLSKTSSTSRSATNGTSTSGGSKKTVGFSAANSLLYAAAAAVAIGPLFL